MPYLHTELFLLTSICTSKISLKYKLLQNCNTISFAALQTLCYPSKHCKSSFKNFSFPVLDKQQCLRLWNQRAALCTCVLNRWTLSEVLLMDCHNRHFRLTSFCHTLCLLIHRLRRSTCAKTGSRVSLPPFVSICLWKMESEEGMCVIFQTEITRTITNKWERFG